MSYGYGYGWGFAPYVSVANRKLHATREAAALKKKGHVLEPVSIEGRTIARSFWGKSWCRNLEVYGDFTNRLPRGRSYLTNGLVLDLKVAPGLVSALVYGTELYAIEISIAKLAEKKWEAIRSECAGKIDSLVELLNGRLSQAVMSVVTRPGTGLFPAPAEIRMSCSCPDSARLCKHLAAALYGIGARLDQRPELLFLLRQADHLELVTAAAEAPVVGASDHDAALAGADLSSIFGIDLEETPARAKDVSRKPKERRPAARRAASPEPAAPAAPAPTSPARKAKGRKAAGVNPVAVGPRPRPVAKPAPSRRRAVARSASTPKQLRTADLLALGISRATIQNWLIEGVLAATGKRGVYRKTKETSRRIEAYLGRATGEHESRSERGLPRRDRSAASRKASRLIIRP